MATKAIIKAQLTEQSTAEHLFKQVLNHGKGRQDILAAISDAPSAALARLNATQSLTNKGAADILDEIVGQIPSEEEARLLMEQTITTERLRLLLQARGDLPSSAAYVASLDTIAQAIMTDMIQQMREDEGFKAAVEALREDNEFETVAPLDTPAAEQEIRAQKQESDQLSTLPEDDWAIHTPVPLFIAMQWAHKLKERADYAEILNIQIGSYRLLHLVLMGAMLDASDDSSEGDNDSDESDDDGRLFGANTGADEMLISKTLIDLNIDSDLADTALAEFDHIPQFSRGEIERARNELAKKRQAQKSAPALVEQGREDAAAIAEKLDF